MCGITGIYHRDDTPVSRTRIEKMTRSPEHRGPDGSGVFIDGGCFEVGQDAWIRAQACASICCRKTDAKGDFASAEKGFVPPLRSWLNEVALFFCMGHAELKI